jgi:hypothetical protein
MNARQQKELREQHIKLRMWKRWRRERVEALLSGPYSAAARDLLETLRTMTTPSSLLDAVAVGPWSGIDITTRQEILALIDAAIIARREKLGMPSFDDPLPGQSPNAFLVLRERLAGNSHEPKRGGDQQIESARGYFRPLLQGTTQIPTAAET